MGAGSANKSSTFMQIFCVQLLEMSKSGSDKKVANGLVAVSCAAVLAVYAAGYSRTRAA
jgi:hypothetical protein